jgi:hypothetical protein
MGGDRLCNWRDFSQFQPVNREISLAEPAFESGFMDRTGSRNHFKKWRLGGQPGDLTKVFGRVCRDPDRAIRTKRPVKRFEKAGCHQTT